jgi:hypothetical protein
MVMNTILILLFCGVVSAWMASLVFALLAASAGARRRNARAHKLGRLLMCSHPEWN